MENCILPVSTNGYATLSQNTLGIHDDTVSNGFSSEVN